MRHEKSGAKRKLGQEKWGTKWGVKSGAIKVAQREKWGEKSEP